MYKNENIDTALLEDTQVFFQSLYDFYAHKFIVSDDKGSDKLALLSFAVAETLRAVLSLAVERR